MTAAHLAPGRFEARLALAPGRWRRLVDTADERWLGSGSTLAEVVESDGEVVLELGPWQLVALHGEGV